MSFRRAYGNTHSENGWRMCDRNECVLVDGPFMDTAPIRAGVPEIILGDFARRYHKECDPITNSVWGFSWENDVPDSNHLSGTALDINAWKWPWRKYTMPRPLIDRIDNLLEQYDDAVFWGRNWDTVDEMHFQLNWPEGDGRYDAVINKITQPKQAKQNYSEYVKEGFLQLIPPRLWA